MTTTLNSKRGELSITLEETAERKVTFWTVSATNLKTGKPWPCGKASTPGRLMKVPMVLKTKSHAEARRRANKLFNLY